MEYKTFEIIKPECSLSSEDIHTYKNIKAMLVCFVHPSLGKFVK